MHQDDFIELYERGREHRHRYSTATAQGATVPLAAFFTHTLDHPPVIGFGLPRRRLPHPVVVTVGINPSTNEFKGDPPPLPLVDDAADQWTAQTRYFTPSAINAPYDEWFSLAARFLRATALAPTAEPSPLSPYSDGNAVHLDLSPVVTSAFIETLSEQVELARKRGDTEHARLIKDSAAAMLANGVIEVLAPALVAIRKVNDISSIVVFGCGFEDGGTSVVNKALRSHLVRDPGSKPKKVGNATVARASPLPIRYAALHELVSVPFILVSQSPSYWRKRGTPLNGIDEIGRACVPAPSAPPKAADR